MCPCGINRRPTFCIEKKSANQPETMAAVAVSCAFCHHSRPFAVPSCDSSISESGNILAGPVSFCLGAGVPRAHLPNLEFDDAGSAAGCRDAPGRTPAPPGAAPCACPARGSFLHSVHVHELCCIWAPSCYTTATECCNVQTELKRAQLLVRTWRLGGDGFVTGVSRARVA